MASNTPNIDGFKSGNKPQVLDKRIQDFLDSIPDIEERAKMQKNYTENLKLASSYVENGSRYIEQVLRSTKNIFSKAGAVIGTSSKMLAVGKAFDYDLDQKMFNNLKPLIEDQTEKLIKALEALRLDPEVMKTFGENAGKISSGIDTLNSRFGPTDVPGTPLKDPNEEEKLNKREKKLRAFFTKTFKPITKGFAFLKTTYVRTDNAISNIKNSILGLPRSLGKSLSKMAMAVPNGIVKITEKLMGGAGKAIGSFISGIGMGFAAVGRVAGPAALGAGVVVLIAGAIAAIGGSVWAIGKGIEAVMTGFGDGLTAISNGMEKLSKTTVNGDNVRKIGEALHGFASSIDFMDGVHLILLRFSADLGVLGTQLQTLSSVTVNGEKLQNIGIALKGFLNQLASFDTTMGAIVTNIFDPENTMKFANVMKALDNVSLNTEKLMAVGEGMGKFMSSLAENSSVYDMAKNSITNFFTASTVFTDLTKNVNALSEIKVVPKESTDAIAYFLNTLKDPISSFTTTGFFANFSKGDFLGNFVTEIQKFGTLNLNRKQMEDSAAGIEAVGHAIEGTFTQGFADALGRGFTNIAEMATGTEIDKVVVELNKFANIKGDFTGLEKLVSLTDRIGEVKQSVYGLRDALQQLGSIKPIGYDIGATIADLNKVKTAADAARAAAVAATINTVNQNTNVRNTNIQQIPIAPGRAPNSADATLGRGR
jgi:hypothetical protein